MSQSDNYKLVGFGMRLENFMGKDYDPGDIARLSDSDFWYLKTMWPDAIFDLTPVRRDPFSEVFNNDSSK
jgi:hypothetical protein